MDFSLHRKLSDESKLRTRGCDPLFYTPEVLPLKPENNIATQPPKGEE
jgi:hypothetical protein